MTANIDTEPPMAGVPADHVREYIEEMLDALAKLAGASGQRRLAVTLQTAALEAARSADSGR